MNENVNVCITPKGEKPVLHFSQFDNENVFTVTVLADDGESAAVLTGLDIEFRLRKTDSHVVTIAPESVADNVITFKTTEQMCACCGQNIATVTLMKDDMVVSTLYILVDIQRDILSGGLTSESDIRNLTTQIEQIVPEVVGDDYYNKQEVDDLLAEHTFDPTNYYDKSDVDDLLGDKADSDDVYTKTETDNLLADKADTDDVMSKVTRHGLGGDTSYYSFDNNCVAPMDDIECDVEGSQSGSGTPSPDNIRPLIGYSSCTITVSDSTDTPVNTCTVSFGQDVYKGVADITGGKITLIYGLVDLGTLSWVYNSTQQVFNATIADIYNRTSGTENDAICSNYAGENVWNASGLSNNCFMIRGDIARIYIKDTNYSDGAVFKTAMNGVMFAYRLSSPVEITFTPATTDTINGHNKVSSSTGNMQSLTYFSDVNSDLVDLIRACMI